MENRSLGQLKGFRMPRRYRAVALTIWPGLAQIWLGQEALGLLLGVCFASTLNLAIVSRWIWREAFAPGWSDFFLILAVAWWLASVAYTLWWVGVCHPDRHRAEIDRLYREAKRLICRGGGAIRNADWSGSWRGMKRTPTLSCNWRHFTSERISRTWLVRRYSNAYN